jgi:tetratricopeptide (TPR) repeat protein
VFRSSVFVLLLASAVGLAQSPSQTPPAAPVPQSNVATAPVAQEVADAEVAIGKSDWKTAETKLDTWLAAHPTDARALFDAGYVADAQNRPEDAINLYKRATQADPDSFEARLSLGLLLARQGKLDEARPELAAATKLDPGEAGPALKARAWRALAEIDKPGPGRKGDATQASNDLLEALKLSPETAADTLLAANLAEDAGQDDAAEATYRRLLAKNPKSAPANAGLAHLMMARKQYPEAETLLRAALDQTLDDPALSAQLAAVLAAENKPEAVPLLEKLHDAHPDNAAITRMLADMLAQTGDAAGADKLYAILLVANPEDPGLLVAHGQELIQQMKYGAAYAAFDKATRVDSASGDAWSGLAFAAMRLGQPAVTIHALTMRSKLLPEVPATYFLWATSYDTLHEKAEAISYYHRFLEASAGKFPDQEWQARQRLILLEKRK